MSQNLDTYKHYQIRKSAWYVLTLFLNMLLVFVAPLQAQIKKHEKIDKVKRNTYNLLETTTFKKKQKKDKSFYVVYSDRSHNNSYLDAYAQKRGEKQKFLSPYYVIDQKNDFLKIVALDPSVIGKPKGFFSFFSSGKFTFKDTKQAKYIGWVHKNNVLHYDHSKLSQYNYKPIRYVVGVHDVTTLYNIGNYVKKDTVYLFEDPKFKDKSDKNLMLDQLVYLYKYDSKKNAVLVANQANIKSEDSTKRIMGWIPRSLIKKVGQQQVYAIDEVDSLVFFSKENLSREQLDRREIGAKILYNATENRKNPIHLSDSIEIVVPVAVWDHYDNKLINVDGEDVLIRKLETIRKENKIINFHYVFDCSSDLKKKHLLLMSSLQQIWVQLSTEEKYKGYKFSFSASSYGCGRFYSFEKSESFAAWIDYLQNVFLDNELVTTPKHNTKGIERCFEYAIAHLPRQSFTNNIIIVSGEKRFLSLPNVKTITTQLGQTSSRLIFYQLENKADNQHQDFVLQSKDILSRVSKHHLDFIRAYIVDNDLIKDENTFISVPAVGNIYVYDAPENSTYQGGVAFPKINKMLAPTSFDSALDSVLTKTIRFNDKFTNSLDYHAKNLGFLRSKSGKKIKELILKDSVYSNRLQMVPKNYMYEKYYSNKGYTPQDNTLVGSGVLLSRDELEIVIDSYKSLIPLFSQVVKRKQRRQLKRIYRRNRKNINKELLRKVLKRRQPIADLVFMKTGLPVQSAFLQNTKMKHVKRRRKTSHEEFTRIIKKLRTKIDVLEKIHVNKNASIYKDGSKKQYYYILDNYIL